MSGLVQMGLSAALAIPGGGPEPPKTQDPIVEAGISRWLVTAGTGQLTWEMPLGRVPGDIPIPVGIRLVSGERRPGPFGLLHLGYVAGKEPGGRLILENGDSWDAGRFEPAPGGSELTSLFGLEPPLSEVFQVPGQRSIRFTVARASLGRLATQVPTGLDGPFHVVLDPVRARVYAFLSALDAWVPILWADTHGHAATFLWQSLAGSDGAWVQVTAASGSRGIRMAFRQTPPAGTECRLAEVECLGFPSPRTDILGRVAMAGNGAGIWCPSAVRMVTGNGGPEEVRSWRLQMGGRGGEDLLAVQDAQGTTTRYTYADWALPMGLRRGVARAEVAGSEGVVRTCTWERMVREGSWTVRFRQDEPGGRITEERERVQVFGLDGEGRERPLSETVEGKAGIRRTLEWEGGSSGGDSYPSSIQVSETGRPRQEITRSKGTTTWIVGGRRVETRREDGPSRRGAESSTSLVLHTEGQEDLDIQESFRPDGRPSQRTMQSGDVSRTMAFAYDPEGRWAGTRQLASWTGSEGPRWSVESGPDGPLEATLEGRSLQTPLRLAWAWDDAGRLVRQTDARGLTTTFTWDGWNRLLKVERLGEAPVLHSYPSPFIREWRQGHRRGRERRDILGRVVERLRSDGVVERLAYDRLGRHVETTEEAGGRTRQVWKTTYDPLDRPVARALAAGATQTFSYSAEGACTRIECHEGKTWAATLWLDPWGRETARKDARGTLRKTLDRYGEPLLIRMENTKGHAQERTFTRDGLGRLLGQAGPETGYLAYGDFDALGLPCRMTEAQGRTTRWTRDVLGRLNRLEGEGATIHVLFQGALLQAKHTEDGVIQTFQSGGPGLRHRRETLAIDGRTWVMEYEADLEHRREMMVYPSGRRVETRRNDRGLPIQVRVDGRPLADFSWDAWGNRTGIRFASGARSLWAWDKEGWRPTGWTLLHRHGTDHRPFDWDPHGRLIRAGEWKLAYDEAGRLSRSSTSALDVHHRHDAFGNVVAQSLAGRRPAGMLSYELGEILDNRVPALLPNGGRSGWCVGPHGETGQMGLDVSSQSVLSLTWNGLGRLVRVENLLTGATEQYRYAPSGFRIEERHPLEPARDRHYVRNDAGLLLAEYGTDGGWLRDVIHVDGEAIAEIDAKGIHELHVDHLGTPRLVTSGATGEPEGRQDFGAFGETLEDPHGTTGYQPLTGFTGHQRTDRTGLIYMRARYYSPAWQRFMSPDHGLDAASLNQFAYVDGDPFQATDPSGLMKKGGPKRYKDGMLDGGGTTVVVEDQTPSPIPQVAVPTNFVNTPVIPVASPFPTFAPSMPYVSTEVAMGSPTVPRNTVDRPWPPYVPPPAYTGPTTPAASHPMVAGSDAVGGKTEIKMSSGNLKGAFQKISSERKDGSARASVSTNLSDPPGPSSVSATMRAFPVANSKFRTWVTATPNGGNDIGKKVGDLDGLYVGECVSLVKRQTGIGRTATWVKGPKVQGNQSLPAGTAIATFDAKGNFRGHAGFYHSQDANVLTIVDQFNAGKGHTVGPRSIPWTGHGTASSSVNRGDAYYVVYTN